MPGAGKGTMEMPGLEKGTKEDQKICQEQKDVTKERIPRRCKKLE
jgi:hypothetical protein